MKKLLLTLLAWIATMGLAFGAVNINTATKEQLDSLKGIGPTKAQAIIDYRTKNGPFKSVDDLEKVPGIGPATMKEIRSSITVTGATTPAKAAEKARKDDTKSAPPAQEKATKKSAEKKKADEKPAVPKDDVKGAAKAEDKAAKKDAAKTTAPSSAADAKDEKKTEKK
jgi:competence protein ComEA